jgi:hypothetical protein
MRKMLPWLSAALIITIIFGTIYAAVQQSLRLSANDPQIELAQEVATKLDEGAKPDDFISGKTDLKQSLAPFVIVYDKSGHVVAGSGYLDRKIPTVAYGVLKAAKSKPYNTVTWQPASKVRLAAVSVAAHDYYVLVGRSLQEVEKRENTALMLAAIGWVAALACFGATHILCRPKSFRQ